MSLLTLATLLVLQAETAKKDLPFQVPQGWTSQKQDQVILLNPKEVPEGKIYAVLVPELTRKVGTLKGLLDAAKETLGEVGTFKPLSPPARSKSGGDWDYEFVIGSLEKDGKAFVGLAMGLQKKEEEGVILILADSVETMQQFADGFAQLVKSVGAPKLVPGVGTAKAANDLKYRLPAGWEAKDQGETVLLQKWQEVYGGKMVFQFIILRAQPLRNSLRKDFLDAWGVHIKPAFETTLVPLPLMRRLRSGLALAYDVDDRAKSKEGKELRVGLYLLSKGKQCVPILAVHSGIHEALEIDLFDLLESAEIPGAGDDKTALFDPADLAGHWDKSSYSVASYVTVGGSFAGDASIAIDESHTLNADGSFVYSFKGIRGGGPAVLVDRKGQWKLDDDWLVLTHAKGEYRHRFFGIGTDAKSGRTLAMSIAADTKERLALSSPRQMFSGSWFRRKD